MSDQAVLLAVENLSEQLSMFQTNISGEMKTLRSDIRQDMSALSVKIDKNKDEATKKIDDLMKDGCAQGRLDRQEAKACAQKIESLEKKPDQALARIAIVMSSLSALITITLGIFAFVKGLVS